MRRRRGAAGFTLIESLVGLVVAVMVLGIALQMLWRVTAWFARSEARLDPREGVHRALTAVRVSLCDAWTCTVAGDGRGVSFATPRADGQLRYDATRRTLQLRAPGDAAFRDLPGPVSAFRAETLRPGLVRLTIEVVRARPGGSPATLRICDDLFLPAVGPP